MVDRETATGRRYRTRGSAAAALCAALAALALAAGCSDSGSDTPPPVLANRVVFAPSTITLDNPSSPGERTSPATFTVGVQVYDEQGDAVVPSAARRLVVEVQGAPDGVITPQRVELDDATPLTFRYDGSYFADPITLVAWVEGRSGGLGGSALGAVAQADAAPDGGTALGRTQLTQKNAVGCTYGPETYTLPVLCGPDGGTAEQCAVDAIENGLQVQAAVGYADPGGNLAPFTVDTGSIGTVVPKSKLGKDVIGPGAAGQVYYDSSGRIFQGHYYLAPVSLALEDGRIVSTPPILVLGIDEQTCAKGHPRCKPDSDPQLHYLGVGFARPGSAVEGFTSPVDNAFLRLAEASGGAVSPGYVVTGKTITVGVASTDGYSVQALTPSTTVAGDWNPVTGCFAFPGLPEPNRFCGNFLLDVGLVEMFLDLPPASRPDDAVEVTRCLGGGEDSRCAYVPDKVPMTILAGTPEKPILSYDFTVATPPVGPAPKYVEWIDKPDTFVNVGRRPLFDFHYLYDARCGHVGFARID